MKMTNKKAQIVIGNIPIKPEVLDDCYDITEYQEAKAMAIKALDQQPCEDCISRDEVIDEINKIGIDAFKTYNDYSELFDFVDALPSVTPQPKAGHWITQHVVSTGHYFTMIICSNCREEFSYDAETGVSMDCYDYCPNCGLKMEDSE